MNLNKMQKFVKKKLKLSVGTFVSPVFYLKAVKIAIECFFLKFSSGFR